MSYDSLKKLETKFHNARNLGGPQEIEKQHKRGKLTARERLEVLLDPNSFEEIGMFMEHRCTSFGMENKVYPGDGVVVGRGTIYGGQVFVYSQDFTILGGSVGECHAKKICNIIDIAIKVGAPVIGIHDSGGARIQEGVDALGGYGEIFRRNVMASGLIPQISVILGPCAGGAVYSPAITDFIFMVRDTSYMFVTGPSVVRAVTSEDIDAEKLGGSFVHATKSGVVDAEFDNDVEALLEVRRLFNFLPLSSRHALPYRSTQDPSDRINMSLNTLVPTNSNKPYDMKELIETIVDEMNFFELQAGFAPNIITGFGYMDGCPVGIVANQPMHLAGCLNIDASRKAARFVRFCNAFSIPIITLVDVPGFLPGSSQEHHGIIKHGAKLVCAYAEATVPLITVIIRKAFGGAYIAMGSKHLGGDINYAWVYSEIAVMGAEGAADIIFRGLSEEEKAVKIQQYKDTILSPFFAASRGYLDEIIEPQFTRPKICKALNLLSGKKSMLLEKKHNNIPL